MLYRLFYNTFANPEHFNQPLTEVASGPQFTTEEFGSLLSSRVDSIFGTAFSVHELRHEPLRSGRRIVRHGIVRLKVWAPYYRANPERMPSLFLVFSLRIARVLTLREWLLCFCFFPCVLLREP